MLLRDRRPPKTEGFSYKIPERSPKPSADKVEGACMLKDQTLKKTRTSLFPKRRLIAECIDTGSGLGKVSELQTHPNLHSLFGAGRKGGHPQREGANLGVFVPVWLVLTPMWGGAILGVFDLCPLDLLKRGSANLGVWGSLKGSASSRLFPLNVLTHVCKQWEKGLWAAPPHQKNDFLESLQPS